MWEWLAQFGFSLVFAAAGAVVPIFNYEAYVVGTAWGGFGSAAVITGMGLGAGIGKAAIILLIRAGRRLPWWRAPRERTEDPSGRWSAFARWWRLRMESLLRLAQRPGLTLPLVVLSAATSIPPLYPLTIVIALTKTKWWAFGIATAIGTMGRCTLLLLIAHKVLG